MDGWLDQLKKQCGNSGMWYVMDDDFLYQLGKWGGGMGRLGLFMYVGVYIGRHTRYRVTYFDFPCTGTSTSNRDKIGMYHRIGIREQQEQQRSKAPPHLPIETAPLSSTPAP